MVPWIARLACSPNASGEGEASCQSAGKLRFVRKIIHGEVAAVIIILLCAAIMARGGWV
jgi:putative membrane protein